MASISTVAPQFLVTDLGEALAFYEERLGFERDFVYAGFYASVSRRARARGGSSGCTSRRHPWSRRSSTPVRCG